ILDNLALDIQATSYKEKDYCAAIRIDIDDATTTPNNAVTIKNCTLNSKTKASIIVEASAALPNKNIVIDNCSISQGQNGIILSDTQSSSISNCNIKNCEETG